MIISIKDIQAYNSKDLLKLNNKEINTLLIQYNMLNNKVIKLMILNNQRMKLYKYLKI